MRKLLSGNEAMALGAYHAGIGVAAAYPGTPSTEILENLARMEGMYVEWRSQGSGLHEACGTERGSRPIFRRVTDGNQGWPGSDIM